MLTHANLQTSTCPLCSHKADYFLNFATKMNNRTYYRCKNCVSVHLQKNEILNFKQEKQRYAMHNNDVEDARYQKFVSPLSKQILKDQNKDAKGLDYGCGPGPVITHILKNNGFHNIALYDPYFFPDKNKLKEKYQFIICCEVIEHFSHPAKEFIKIKNLLVPNGKFYGKTELLYKDLNIDGFKEWWYKNDPTHCFFYSKETLKYITELNGFSSLIIKDKFFVLSN